MKENIKVTAELSSLERMAEPSVLAQTAGPSSLERIE